MRDKDWTPAMTQQSGKPRYRTSPASRPARTIDPPLKNRCGTGAALTEKRQCDRTAARALGWLSIGIGLTELLFTKRIQRTIGMEDEQSAGMIRVCGVREVAQGVDILVHDNPAPGMCARVTGDIIDGVLLGCAATKTNKLAGLATIAAAVLPVVVADAIVCPRVTAKEGLK